MSIGADGSIDGVVDEVDAREGGVCVEDGEFWTIESGAGNGRDRGKEVEDGGWKERLLEHLVRFVREAGGIGFAVESADDADDHDDGLAELAVGGNGVGGGIAAARLGV